MKTIEDHIKQEVAFTNIRRKLLVNLIFTSHRISKEMDRFFMRYGITNKQYNVLRIIKGAKEQVSTSYIKDRMLVQNADVSRLVDRMIAKGLLAKSEDSEDKRLISIHITDNGFHLMKLVASDLEDLDEMTEGLTLEECKQLNYLLNKINN